MWIVLDCDCYSLEDTFGMYSVRGVYGPFSSEEDAQAFADKQGDQYATEYQVRELIVPN